MAEAFRILEKVGEGSFGTVFRAVELATGAEVALKKIRVRDVRVLPVNAVRELLALRQLHHPNVMRLLGTHTHGANLVLVLPFVPCSLGSLLSRRDAPLPERHASALARMLLQGVCAIHAEGLLHRDIKPNNLLLSADGVLLIGDFGQARLRPPLDDASLTPAVATRWYRAPELLLGARRYGVGIDVWACGCVIAQLLSLSPLLPGESDIDQLARVVMLLGSPTDANWPGVRDLPDYGKIELPTCEPTPLATALPLASAPAREVVGSMVAYDPAARMPPRRALAAPWVADSPPLPPLALLCPADESEPPPPPPHADAPPAMPAANCRALATVPECAAPACDEARLYEEMVARLQGQG